MQSSTPTAPGANRPPEAAEFTLATARAADVPAIVALVNGAYRGDSSRRGWTTEADLLGGQRTDSDAIAEAIARPDKAILLLRAGLELCACVLLERLPERICYLRMLTVRPELQGSGIGRRLLTAAEIYARDHFDALQVEMTVLDLRRELVAWYERRGYQQTGELRPYPYGDDRVGLPQRDDLRFTVLRRRIAPAD